MLVLERQLGQKIKIGDDVTVVILAASGGQIKFGIEAPRSITVNRSEIYCKRPSHLNEHSCGSGEID